MASGTGKAGIAARCRRMRSSRESSVASVSRPPIDVGLGRHAVLQEEEAAAGSQDPVHLAERPPCVGNGAEGEGTEGSVDRLVTEREILTIQADELDRHRRASNTLGRQAASDG